MDTQWQPDVFPRTFEYGPLGKIGAVAMIAFYVWLVFEFHRQEGWSGWLIVFVLLLPAAILEWAMQPTRFVEEGENLTAIWVWGRRRTWLIRDLTIPGVSRSWAFGLSGSTTVYLRSGGKAFDVGLQLEDFDEFVELIEPGSRLKRVPKWSPRSWWNRDIQK